MKTAEFFLESISKRLPLFILTLIFASTAALGIFFSSLYLSENLSSIVSVEIGVAAKVVAFYLIASLVVMLSEFF